MKKQKRKIKYILPLAIICIGIYLIPALYSQAKFAANTKIEDYNVSLMTKEEAEERVKKGKIGSYQLEIETIDDRPIIISADQIDLDLELDLSGQLSKQNNWLWFTYLFEDTNLLIDYNVVYDEEKLENEINTYFNESNMTMPTDAYISEYQIGVGYEIIPETTGNYLMKDIALKEIKESINKLDTNIDLVKLNCYEQADITSKSKDLIEQLEQMNQAVSASITYELGNENLILDADTYHSWLSFENGEVCIKEEAAAEFVTELISKTDTAYTNRNFVTTSGQVVTVTGPYGYRIAKNDERTQLIEDLLSGETVVRKPTYVREGASRLGNDYGTTYIEIDLTNQKVYLYVNGELIKSSSCVTGNVSKNYTTPPGIYPLTYKQKDAVLRGPGYASPVTYWMPFNGGIGLHDASWRSNFGGTIYKTNGSHGCVNLPYEMAKTIFENAYAGMPVICYN